MPHQEEDMTDFGACFWGEEDDGIDVLLNRLEQGEMACQKVCDFIEHRVRIEHEYADGLKKLSSMLVCKDEYPSLKRVMYELSQETAIMSKTHYKLGADIRSVTCKKLADVIFRERAVRQEQKDLCLKHLRAKVKAISQVKKARDCYFKNCKAKEILLSRRLHPLSRDYDKYSEKVRKLMCQTQEDDQVYMSAVKQARASHFFWTEAMKSACSECQAIEEDRIQVIEKVLIDTMNLSKLAGATDIQSCDNVLMSIEQCVNIQGDLQFFCDKQGTGRTIPSPPLYINYYTQSPMEQSDPVVAETTNAHQDNVPPCPDEPVAHQAAAQVESCPPGLFLVRAAYSYAARASEELQFKKGQVIIVTSLEEDPWWEGYLENNQEKRGVFPSNYVCKIQNDN